MFVDMPRHTGSKPVEINGFALRVIREQRGRKVAELAEKLAERVGSCDRSYITHLENGSKTRVGAEFYSALLAELHIEDYRTLLANPHAAEVPA